MQHCCKCEQVGLLHPQIIVDERTHSLICCHYPGEAPEKAAYLKLFAFCVETAKDILDLGCVNNLLRHLPNDRDGELSLSPDSWTASQSPLATSVYSEVL